MRVLGAVLSGGRASRFGGDKLVADVAGATLIECAIAHLSPQVAAVVLLGRAYGDLPALPDRPAPDYGPLGGLNAALHYAVAQGFDAVLMVPGDAPDLPSDLLAQLGEAPCYAKDSPVTGLWPATLAPMLDAYLGSGAKRAVAAFGDHVGAQAVTLSQPIVNINTPEDYARYSQR